MTDILDKVMTSKEESEKKNISFVETVNTLLSLLKAREAEILRLRFGLFDDKKHTLEEIGKKMNLTRERIRQLERIAKSNIKCHKSFDSVVSPARSVVERAFKEHGGVVSRSRMASYLQGDDSVESHRKAVEFLIDNFVDEVQNIKHNLFADGWYLHENYLSLASEAVTELKSIIEKIGKLVAEEELFTKFRDSEYFFSNKDRYEGFLEKNEEGLKNVINAYLDVSKDLGSTPFSQWGLANWRSVKPRRINDKIYLVLDYQKKPMHFRDIADKINEAAFDHKVAHPATIHNDLISDERFVLIGRGVYALKEWGYKSGVVADIIEEVMKKEARSLSRDEVIEKVLEQRDVKANTVALALNKDDRFVKSDDGRFELKK